MSLSREDQILLHQYDDLLKDIHNRERLVWTIGGIYITASFLLIAYSLTNINNKMVVVFGGIISIILLWFFHFLNVDYSFINKKKFVIREKIEGALNFKYKYEHKRSYTGWALFFIVFIIHFGWSIIWLFYDYIIGKTEFYDYIIGNTSEFPGIPNMVIISIFSFLILFYFTILLKKYNTRKKKEIEEYMNSLNS